ncbi:hypothetical protein Cadr_000025834 [Camelus dromedarius]|uniref:Uncharacterized protein n=1 Tax=Camelus dromedarius TaxID=9838 RepID=A0A5N4CLE2_CAMDR|nr:hypothetical protein Cadr_000025834 [Camelus dromedarius]
MEFSPGEEMGPKDGGVGGGVVSNNVGSLALESAPEEELYESQMGRNEVKRVLKSVSSREDSLCKGPVQRGMAHWQNGAAHMAGAPDLESTRFQRVPRPGQAPFTEHRQGQSSRQVGKGSLPPLRRVRWGLPVLAREKLRAPGPLCGATGLGWGRSRAAPLLWAYSRTQQPGRPCEPWLLMCGLGDNPAHPELGQGGTTVWSNSRPLICGKQTQTPAWDPAHSARTVQQGVASADGEVIDKRAGWQHLLKVTPMDLPPLLPFPTSCRLEGCSGSALMLCNPGQFLPLSGLQFPYRNWNPLNLSPCLFCLALDTLRVPLHRVNSWGQGHACLFTRCPQHGAHCPRSTKKTKGGSPAPVAARLPCRKPGRAKLCLAPYITSSFRGSISLCIGVADTGLASQKLATTAFSSLFLSYGGRKLKHGSCQLSPQPRTQAWGMSRHLATTITTNLGTEVYMLRIPERKDRKSLKASLSCYPTPGILVTELSPLLFQPLRGHQIPTPRVGVTQAWPIRVPGLGSEMGFTSTGTPDAPAGRGVLAHLVVLTLQPPGHHLGHFLGKSMLGTKPTQTKPEVSGRQTPNDLRTCIQLGLNSPIVRLLRSPRAHQGEPKAQELLGNTAQCSRLASACPPPANLTHAPHVIAGRAEDSALLLKEATLFQDLPTLAAHELLGVVRVAQRHQVAAPEEEAGAEMREGAVLEQGGGSYWVGAADWGLKLKQRNCTPEPEDQWAPGLALVSLLALLVCFIWPEVGPAGVESRAGPGMRTRKALECVTLILGAPVPLLGPGEQCQEEATSGLETERAGGREAEGLGADRPFLAQRAASPGLPLGCVVGTSSIPPRQMLTEADEGIQTLRTQARSLPHSNRELNPPPPTGAAEMSGEVDGRAEVGKTPGLEFRSGKARVGKEQGHPPDDLVALVAHGSLAGPLRQLPAQWRCGSAEAWVWLAGCAGSAPCWSCPGRSVQQMQGPQPRGLPRPGKWLQGDPTGKQGEPRAAWRGPPPLTCPWRLPTLPQAQAHSLSPGQGSWGVAEAGAGAGASICHSRPCTAEAPGMAPPPNHGPAGPMGDAWVHKSCWGWVGRLLLARFQLAGLLHKTRRWSMALASGTALGALSDGWAPFAREQYHRAEGRQCQMEPGPGPGGWLGPGQQEAHSRGRKAVGEAEEQKERGREGSRPATARLGLHVEHVGRALVVPVPEAGVARRRKWKERETEGRKGERKVGRREGEWKSLARDSQEQTQGGGWNGRGRSSSCYLDFFRCSSSGSCTERAEAGIDQEKREGHPSPGLWQRARAGGQKESPPCPGLALTELGAREVGKDAERTGLACPRPRPPVLRVLHQPLLAGIWDQRSERLNSRWGWAAGAAPPRIGYIWAMARGEWGRARPGPCWGWAGNQGERRAARAGRGHCPECKRKEERDRQRGLTDLSGTDGQIKDKGTDTEEERWQGVRIARGKAALSVWGSDGPTPHPNPGPPAGDAASRGRSHTVGGALCLQPPPPAARGRCRTADGAAAGSGLAWGRGQTAWAVGGGRAGRTGRGRPKGPGRLVEGGAGCKGVPRGVRGGGQGLGGDRAGREGGDGAWPEWGAPPPGAERTEALQPHPHTSGLRLRGEG